jgi:hypothetical protein
MIFSELVKNIDSSILDTGYYTSTLCDIYQNVNESNYRKFIADANSQIDLLLHNNKWHGFFLVDWRVNFGNLYDFVLQLGKSEKLDSGIKKFEKLYNDLSAPELYKRLGLDC